MTQNETNWAQAQLLKTVKVPIPNSFFMSSRLLGNTNFTKTAASPTWFAVQ